MTTRYLTLPATDPLTIVDLVSGDPAKDANGEPSTMPRANLLRVLVSGILQRETLDVLDAQVLRGKLLGANPIELTDAEHQELLKEAKKPSLLTVHGKCSPDVLAVLRAIADAPTTKPEPPTP